MAHIYPSNYNDFIEAQNALNLTSGLDLTDVTNFGLIYQDILLSAGASITFWWNYVSEDYAPYDDGCFAPISGPGGQQVQLLARTYSSNGCLVPATGDYGSTGWHKVTLTVLIAGPIDSALESLMFLILVLTRAFFWIMEPVVLPHRAIR